MSKAMRLALRRVKRDFPGLGRWQKKNDDVLGWTYVADAIRDYGYIIVEFYPGPVDDCHVAVSRDQTSVAYYSVTARGMYAI